MMGQPRLGIMSAREDPKGLRKPLGFKKSEPRRRKLAVKVVDIFGNDTMTIVNVTAGGKL